MFKTGESLHRGLCLIVLVAAVAVAGCSDDTAEADLGKAANDGGGPAALTYPIVDTAQTSCYGNLNTMACPAAGNDFHGQDAQHAGNAPGYSASADGLTVRDKVTGLTWQRSADVNGDGKITATDKLTLTQALAHPAKLNTQKHGGFTDWRLPSIKELYSLIIFTGGDPSGYSGTDTSSLVPFIDATFKFAYGDTGAGERVIDAQYVSSTRYVSTASGDRVFGVNFADGRIKGYTTAKPTSGDKVFFVLCVRGNKSYGKNDFKDNKDGTITDRATGLTWSAADSGKGMNWKDALAWVASKNAAKHLGHADWRLPGAKELQSILDYTRAPDATSSAAIDPLFTASTIKNEAGETDYPYYWSGTTHATYNGKGGGAAYLAFGRAMGYQKNKWVDVHGAGAQRSDPKKGDPKAYPKGHGPQGDAIRILNHVRLVRGATVTP